MWQRAGFCVVSVVVLSIVLGCSGSEGPETVEVTGTISMNGRPVEAANVIFHPVDASTNALASQARTDADGRFVLQTHVGSGKYHPGIAPGKYAVEVTKLDTAAIASTLAPPRNVLPKRYANQATSGLTAEVKSDGVNDFPFDLSQE